MTPFNEYLENTIIDFEREFENIILTPSSVERSVAEAMIYATESGGKRIRPFMVLETARMLGADLTADDRFFKAAAAVELIHSYSLVHDDLPAMDNDEMRRGKPSVWKAFDEATAILAGDGLLTLAFEVIADYPVLVKALAKAAGYHGMVAGQALDLYLVQHPKDAPKERKRMQLLKTGELFRYALTASALLLDVPQNRLDALTDYAKYFGLLFQVTDDMLDGEGDPEQNQVLAYEYVENALATLKIFPDEQSHYLKEMLNMILHRKK